jgi:hypothetical protein
VDLLKSAWRERRREGKGSGGRRWRRAAVAREGWRASCSSWELVRSGRLGKRPLSSLYEEDATLTSLPAFFRSTRTRSAISSKLSLLAPQPPYPSSTSPSTLTKKSFIEPSATSNESSARSSRRETCKPAVFGARSTLVWSGRARGSMSMLFWRRSDPPIRLLRALLGMQRRKGTPSMQGRHLSRPLPTPLSHLFLPLFPLPLPSRLFPPILPSLAPPPHLPGPRPASARPTTSSLAPLSATSLAISLRLSSDPFLSSLAQEISSFSDSIAETRRRWLNGHTTTSKA